MRDQVLSSPRELLHAGAQGWTERLEEYLCHGVSGSAEGKSPTEGGFSATRGGGDEREKDKEAAGKPKGPYALIAKERLQGIYLALFVHTSCLPHLLDQPSRSRVTAGLVGGRLGNKGAVGISLLLGGYSFLFVSAHLAAHAEREEERNLNVRKIAGELGCEEWETGKWEKARENRKVSGGGDKKAQSPLEKVEAKKRSEVKRTKDKVKAVSKALASKSSSKPGSFSYSDPSSPSRRYNTREEGETAFDRLHADWLIKGGHQQTSSAPPPAPPGCAPTGPLTPGLGNLTLPPPSTDPAKPDYKALLEFDQLKKVLAQPEGPFKGFKESEIMFAPTFKYDLLMGLKRGKTVRTGGGGVVGMRHLNGLTRKHTGNSGETGGWSSMGGPAPRIITSQASLESLVSSRAPGTLASADDSPLEPPKSIALTATASAPPTPDAGSTLFDIPNNSEAGTHQRSRSESLATEFGLVPGAGAYMDRAKDRLKALVRSKTFNEVPVLVSSDKMGGSQVALLVPEDHTVVVSSASAPATPARSMVQTIRSEFGASVASLPAGMDGMLAPENVGMLDSVYDSSAKQRVQSWTDRVLYRSNVPTEEEEQAAEEEKRRKEVEAEEAQHAAGMGTMERLLIGLGRRRSSRVGVLDPGMNASARARTGSVGPVSPITESPRHSESEGAVGDGFGPSEVKKVGKWKRRFTRLAKGSSGRSGTVKTHSGSGGGSSKGKGKGKGKEKMPERRTRMASTVSELPPMVNLDLSEKALDPPAAVSFREPKQGDSISRSRSPVLSELAVSTSRISIATTGSSPGAASPGLGRRPRSFTWVASKATVGGGGGGEGTEPIDPLMTRSPSESSSWGRRHPKRPSSAGGSAFKTPRKNSRKHFPGSKTMPALRIPDSAMGFTAPPTAPGSPTEEPRSFSLKAWFQTHLPDFLFKAPVSPEAEVTEKEVERKVVEPVGPKKGEVQCLLYDSVNDLRAMEAFSDHRPVVAVFSVGI